MVDQGKLRSDFQRKQSIFYGGCRLGREWEDGGLYESGYEFLKRLDCTYEWKARGMIDRGAG